MHRTTILLPDFVRKAAQGEARARGISLGELIRRKLVEGVKEVEAKQPVFFRRESWKGNTPADLSKNHDTYLYGS